MLFKLLVFLFVFGTISSSPIPFKDCGSNGVKVNYFDVKDCTTFPCIFKKNSNATLTLNFTANKSFSSIKNLAFGIIAGVTIPFPLPQSDACSNGISCPLSEQSTYSESLSIPILSAYPSNYTTEWKIKCGIREITNNTNKWKLEY